MNIRVTVEAPDEIVRLFEKQRALADELQRVTLEIYEKTFADMTLDSGEIGKAAGGCRRLS